jgi:hypothetical protein
MLEGKTLKALHPCQPHQSSLQQSTVRGLDVHPAMILRLPVNSTSAFDGFTEPEKSEPEFRSPKPRQSP